MMTFTDCVIEFNLKNHATAFMEIKGVLNKLGLNTELYLRGSNFSTNGRIVNLHPFRGTHFVGYTNEKYFVSYGCTAPFFSSDFVIERIGKDNIHGIDSYCAVYCFCIFYLTKKWIFNQLFFIHLIFLEQKEK